MNQMIIRTAGWTALINTALSVAIMATLVAFFIIGGIWGTINDAISVAWAISFLPILIVLYQLNRHVNPPLAMISVISGIVSMILFAFSQSLLVLSRVSFEETFLAVITLGAILALALLANGFLALKGQTLPSGLARLMIVFGLAYTLSAMGFWLGGWQNPLAAIGYLIGAIVGPIWAAWLGRLLLSFQVSSAFYIGRS